MFEHCLCINRSDAASTFLHESPDASVDTFSRQDTVVCFQDVKSCDAFFDAVKRARAAAAQVSNYIDSLPLKPIGERNSSGNKA
jgi:hypothetical protein